MEKLVIEEGRRTPEIIFSPEENHFCIRGTSAPEDVRSMYYPVIEWFKGFKEELIKDGKNNGMDTLVFQMDLMYFNSSSAKFFYDLLAELKDISASGLPVKVEWYYEEEDADMKEAGMDFAEMLEMDFAYIEKPS
ncbi:MAG: DUF1987 domain-containing protein [Bacteroidetes bacterium]|jgi:hypothetical protein|nr:DUF1987 domain-containing protein [Bacteroidota bacterium]